ncbi:uncharacterized protein LOC129923389 [Biomphalaria glabrata]|uniref:Uncharacterized protein LOC129923389 n=1 Tax=Biomphalaria glabrata TaxID=6526 RepID=A0A9W2Z571_BIOGL|nr:uncharacterized protein LOC129923389 [Biomphalaria glabrata]
MREPIQNLTPPIDQISKIETPQNPPWLMNKPKLNLSLLNFKKENTYPSILQVHFRELQESYRDCGTIYTDGSKMEGKVACACSFRNKTISRRLPDGCSIFTAELHAILLALMAVKASERRKFIICSDSKSALQALGRMKIDIPLVHKSLKLLDQITADRRDVTFIWVPSHVDIEGNKAADREAKRALNHAVSGTQIPYSDLRQRQSIASATYREWQNRWEAETYSKLRQIVADVRWRPTSKGLTRRGSTTMSRLRIGHTYITHSFVLKKEEPPLCEYCDSRLTVEHILVDCPRYQDVRAKYFRVTNLNTLFDNVDPGKVLGFIREVGLSTKI